MIKKTIAVASIMLASIVLLAHAIVPHHHHNKQVCLVNSHCTNDNKDEHGSTDKSHSHDGENNSDHCVLKESVAVLSNQWKGDLKFENNRSDRSGLDDYHYNLLYNSTEFVIYFLFSYIHERHPDC